MDVTVARTGLRSLGVLGRVFGVMRAAVTVEMGTRIDLQRLVNDVAGHVRGFREYDRPRLDLALDRSAQLHKLRENRSLDHCGAADPHSLAANVALDLAVDLDIAC